MKTVINIVMAVILLTSGTIIVPKLVVEFKKNTIFKIDKGLSPLSPFTRQLILKYKRRV